MEATTMELNGYGDGYGYGSGSGSGYGYGDGYSGSGSGSGYGYGDGYGYGYGSGYGYGYGYGDGDSDGDGYGYGYGYGYGDGDGSGSGYYTQEYFQALLKPHQQDGLLLAFWRSNLDGTPANGGSGTVAQVGLVETIKGPLQCCTKKALHATLKPQQWKGDRWWIVGLYPPVQQDEDKMGALKRIILADLGKCPF